MWRFWHFLRTPVTLATVVILMALACGVGYGLCVVVIGGW